MIEKSKCCEAYVIVDSGEDGANCYICKQCQLPCDLIHNIDGFDYLEGAKEIAEISDIVAIEYSLK